MRLDDKTYDEIFVKSWEAALNECERTLEDHDHQRAEQVRTLADFRTELEKLMNEYPDPDSQLAIELIYPTLEHYEEFALNFVELMSQAVDVGMMWGLLFLVFKLALGEKDDTSHLKSITKWLEKIGHKLRASNEGWDIITDLRKIKPDATEVHRELVVLWLNIIMTFRNQGQERGGNLHTLARLMVTVRLTITKPEGWLSLDADAWDSLTARYNAAYQTIEEAVQRIESVANTTRIHAQSMADQAQFQRLLDLQGAKPETASLPCNTLPVAENKAFFGRKHTLDTIDQHLDPTNTHAGLTSVALYGLGGIGKTQIALAYAYRRLHDLDAIFWISSEDVLSVQQSFSRVAVSGLELPDATPGAHQENMVLVLDWLQRTSTKWLLIFDNVDRHNILDKCWPASKHGAILVTTRDELVATLPIDLGLEVTEFEPKEGAEFLLRMAPKRRAVEDESMIARNVATELGGLPLALNQMAALVNARGCSIQDFSNLYSKHQRLLHKQRKSGWKYLGYEHALDTVWELSFNTLGGEARSILGVVSFLSADSVPTDIFNVTDLTLLNESLKFCEDELLYGEALEELTHHALVRKTINQDAYRIHRLVQSEYLARMEDRQEAFEAAVKLLLDKFPSQRDSTFDDDEWLLFEKYVPQVLALARNYNESQNKPVSLKSDMNFVQLLTNAVNAVHDNDTANIVGGLLDTANSSYLACPEKDRDRLLWAFLQNLNCMHHLKTTDFSKAEEESRESLEIRQELLPPDDLLLHLGYSWLSMSIAAQGRYDEGLALILEAGKILSGPAGDAPTRKMVWRYNTSRNYYCMGKFEEAEVLLLVAVAEADARPSWYNQVYGHLTMASLRVRMSQIDDARSHVEIAKHVLETAGRVARFSWVSSQCSYGVGCVAMLQNQVQEAIEETEKSVTIGKLTNIPTGVLSRCTHAYSKALAMDPSRQDEAVKQRLEARRLRALLPGHGGDLDDESDAAFDMLVRMDQR